MDRSRRLDQTIDAFTAIGTHAMVVSKPANIRWLVGFTGSSGVVVLRPGRRPVLITDGRYTEQAGIEADRAGLDVELVITRESYLEVARLLEAGWRCAVESHHLTLEQAESLRQHAEEVVIEHAGSLIDELRQTKDHGEIARLRQAAQIADRALAAHETQLVEGGVTERQLARSLEDTMFELGAEALSFDTIVASGPNSSRPHARPTSRSIEPGDLVVIDFGASIDGYGSDMTRTFVCGGEPTNDQQELYAAVERAQAGGVAAVRAGVDQVAVDAACRDSLANDGLGEAFIHGTGHGLGLEIHEQPILSARSVGILTADLVVTVEPGAYVPGRGGVRIEDSVVVTSNGCEPITHFPKGLVPWPASLPTI